MIHLPKIGPGCVVGNLTLCLIIVGISVQPVCLRPKWLEVSPDFSPNYRGVCFLGTRFGGPYFDHPIVCLKTDPILTYCVGFLFGFPLQPPQSLHLLNSPGKNTINIYNMPSRDTQRIPVAQIVGDTVTRAICLSFFFLNLGWFPWQISPKQVLVGSTGPSIGHPIKLVHGKPR